MPRLTVVYLSTSGNTKTMADAIVEGATSRNKVKMATGG